MENKPDLNQVIRTSHVRVAPGRFAVVKAQEPLPASNYFCIIKGSDETTVMVEESYLDTIACIDTNKWFKLIEIAVSLPFYAVGMIATVATALAKKGLPVMVYCAFSKDYLLMREPHIEAAIEALGELGFLIDAK